MTQNTLSTERGTAYAVRPFEQSRLRVAKLSLQRHEPRRAPPSMRRVMQALPLFLAPLLVLVCSTPAQAQLSQRFGPYELHYSVVNTTFLEPAVAAEYGIARGRRRAILNLSLREHLDDGTTVARPLDINGSSWDLTQQRVYFDFIEVREGPAIYYIGEFKFINREWRFFEADFKPEGSSERFTWEYKYQMYINE